MKLPVELSHAEARKLISKALDSKLDHAQAETLEQHLQDCGECRAYAAQLETLDHNLKHELRNRWPEQDSSSSRVAAVYDEIQPALKRNKRKDSRAVTLRSLGWSALAIVLIASLAWTIKTLAPIPSQVPAEETTVEPTSPVLEASQVITPTQAVIANTAEGLLTGSWSATTDFGQLIFTVDEAPARITRIDYLFTNWSCGEITQTSEIVDASSWLFTGNQFTAYSTFDRDGQLTMEINGSYDPASQKLTGTWQQAAQGSLCSGPWEALPATIAAPNLPNAPASQFPNLLITFAASLPSSPTKMMVYQQQLSEAVNAESARQVANEWGVAGGVYSSPSEGMNDTIFDVMDGARFIRFLNFPDQFIYTVGYASPNYGSALMDNGPLPSFDEQVSIAESFLKPLGILDMPYRTVPMETERGMVAFIPLLDGFPVIQEIGVDRSNIGWIDVKVNTPGNVTMVQYSDHEYLPIGEYPILTAEQAWERFTADTSFQHSRYAVLSPEGENSYQTWLHKYKPGQETEIYGWVEGHQPAEVGTQPLVMINNLPLIGDITGLVPDNPYDIRFVHAWGQIQGSPTDGVALRVQGWEDSTLADEYITGTLTTQAGQTILVNPVRTLLLIEPPPDIPDGMQVGIQGVVLMANQPALNWKFIETGQMHLSYGASNSCGGGGSGGGGSANADFGGGRFSQFNVDGQDSQATVQEDPPYKPGDALDAVESRVYVTQHIYLGGSTSLDVILSPDPSSSPDQNWVYSLIGENLKGIEQYNNLPIRIWGQVDRLEPNTVYVEVSRFEPVYPGEQIQAWSGTEQITNLDGQDVVLFTTLAGESYVLKSSLVWGAEGNIIGRLGDLIEIEGYLIPDQQMGGYTLMQDIAGTAQPDGIVDSAIVPVLDHSQDLASNPGAVLQGTLTIETVELAYDAINLDRCNPSAADDPNLVPWLVVQPMWVFNGHFDDGRRFIVQVQALPEEFLK